MRQNKITGEWVIYASERGKRPHDWKKDSASDQESAATRADCPFCPGNESMLPAVILELCEEGKEEWSTRVVPNKYPVLNTENELGGRVKGIYETASAYGLHEVIIETPHHTRDIVRMDIGEVDLVLETYLQRYRQLQGGYENILSVIIFRNHGSGAGTSLRHPHSQLAATAVVPQYIQTKKHIAERYFSENGRCILCELAEYEQADASRIVLSNEGFVGLVPFAAEVPYEVWLIPKRHNCDFGCTEPGERTELAQALQQVLRQLYDKLEDPDYNYIIHSYSAEHDSQKSLHWYLQIRPRLVTAAGFEIGSRIRINPSLPEADAKKLRTPGRETAGE